MINDLKNRYDSIFQEFPFFGTRYEAIALLNIATKAKNLALAAELEMKKRGYGQINGSIITAEKPEIVAQSHIIRSCQYCGNPIKSKRADAKFCSKNCNNKSRYNGKNSALDA